MSLSGPSRSARRLIASGVWVLAAGCAHFSPSPRLAPAPAVPAAAPLTLAALPDYIRPRVATVFWGADALTLTTAASAAAGPQAGFKFSPQGDFGYGVAAAIDARGYFLTAAHVVKREPVYVIVLDGPPGKPEPRILRARIVFKGAPAGQGTDLAVLRVGAPLAAVFGWAQTYADGEPVVSAGRDDTQPGANALGAVLLGGHLVGSIAESDARPPRTTLFHTTPIRSGYSGGPLLTTGGELLAINVAYAQARNGPPLGPSLGATAHRPDLGWLREVIDADWVQNPK